MTSKHVDGRSVLFTLRVKTGVHAHQINKIRRHECDVKHALERKGSPYSLVLTKTVGSFQRALKSYEANRRLLEKLPVVE